MFKANFPRKIIGFLALALFASNAWSYRCPGRDCKEPSFKEMMPTKSSVVKPGAEFSFTASADTNPKSIKVMVKGHEVDLKITNKGAIKVSGNLPAEVTDGYARINITASSSPSSCIGTGGWLLKIGE